MPGQRIAFYLADLQGGGLSRATVSLANSLIEQGYAVDVVLEEKTGPVLDELSPDIAVYELVKGSKKSVYFKLLKARPREGIAQVIRKLSPAGEKIRLSRVVALADYFERARPDFVVCSLPLPIFALWARAIAGTDVRIVAAIHNSMSHLAVPGGNNNERIAHRRRYYLHVLKPVMREIEGIVSVSDGAGRAAAQELDIPPEHIATIYNPVFDAHFLQKASEPVADPWFESSYAIPVILAVGRLVPLKGFDVLIRAFAQMRATYPARLLILGDGPERPRLESLREELGLEDDIKLPGWVHNPVRYMQRSALFVLASESEALSMVLIEALACGCPVVATDCPTGPSEVLEGGRYGPLVPVGDVPALARAMKNTLQQPLSTELLVSRGQEFSTERCTAAYIAFFDSLSEAP